MKRKKRFLSLLASEHAKVQSSEINTGIFAININTVSDTACWFALLISISMTVNLEGVFG